MKNDILIILVIIAAGLAAHGWSLSDGLLLDDHWHKLRLQEDDWSLTALLEAATIKPDRFMDTWWQEKPICWKYIRPFSILVAKVVYHLSAGSVKALHALSISLHIINAVFIYHICFLLTRRRFWSLVGGLLMVVYSHSVYAVAWLAAQNTVLMTTLMLAALICYIRASGLDLYPYRNGPKSRGPRQAGFMKGRTAQPARPSTVPLNRLLFLLAVVLWSLAILSRENAVVLPVILAAFDVSFGGWRHIRRRWGGYLLMASIGIAFLCWRLVWFYHPIPDFYMRRPDGPGYWLWCLAKLMHYVTSAIWLSPMTVGPTGRYQPFVEVPGDCLLMFVILAVLGTGFYLACRGARGYWIWPLWIVLSMLPVVPVLATPHSGYMPGVGFAIGMVLGPGLREHIKPVSVGRWSPGVAIWFLIATTIYMPIYRAMWKSFLAAERCTIARIEKSPPPATATELFFINLPFVNIYAQLHLRETLKNTLRADLQALPVDFRCHVLTYAPNVLRMENRCQLKQLDAYSFSIAIEGRPYFSGVLGRFLIEAMRSGGRMQTGQVIKTDLFEVEIVRADAEGVREMVFRFSKPLASSRYCFYLGTNRCAATRVYFWGPEEPRDTEMPVEGAVTMADIDHAGRGLADGDADSAAVLFAGMKSSDPQLRLAAWTAFRRVGQVVAEALASPVQGLLESGEPPSWEPSSSGGDLAQLYKWWYRSVNDRVLEALRLWEEEFTGFRWRRDRLFRIRQIAARIIRTDLYLTGPEFPGPR